jgi:hypothetical protein
MYQVRLCCVSEIYMLITFSVCQVLPHGNIIHEGQILDCLHRWLIAGFPSQRLGFAPRGVHIDV